MTDQDRLEGLLDRWEESREQGQELSPSELCEKWPELADELAVQIRVLKRTDWLFEPDDEDDVEFLPLPPAESLSASVLVPASLTLEEFTANIAASGVMTAEEVSGFDRADALDLAAYLLRTKKLTEYQAKLIADGNTKGLVLGNYLILDKIGAGGMGRVFKARHRRMKRLVALKVLPDRALDSPTMVERFHREVEAAAKLEHPNIVTAHDADEFDGIHFLVMQYVEGQDLASLVHHGGPITVAKAVDCIVQAAKGLAYAHGAGVIHRDIKPANLLLDKQGTVKILDMGLARLEKRNGGNSAATQDHLTQDGTAMGTIDFMSPEQAMDAHAADARSDIYSLGCTLFYLLTGKPPYEGRSLLAKMMAHKEADIPSLHAREGVPVELSRVFEKMVAKQPDDRYETATALLEDLEKVAGESVDDESPAETRIPSHPALDPQFTETSSAALDQTLELQPRAKPAATESVSPTPRAGWPKLIGGGVAVLALAIFGWFYFAGILFKVQTPDGIIQIESNVSDIEVYVDNEKVVCLTDPNDRKRIRVEVKPGAKTLTVSKDGFEADTSQFNLNTVNGPIEVTFVPVPKQEEPPAPVGGDLYRQVAEWVIGVGGRVVLDNSELEIIEHLDDLPGKPFCLRSVYLEGDIALDESELGRIAQLDNPNGMTLSFNSNPNFTDGCLECLSGCATLKVLSLSGTKITDAGLAHLVDHPQLVSLSLRSTAVTDVGLKHLEKLKTLAILGLNSTSVSQKGVASLLKKLPVADYVTLDDEDLWVNLDHEDLAQGQRAHPECYIGLPGHSNRTWAYWVLWLGGSLEVLIGGDEPVPLLVDNAALIPKEAFQIKAINFEDSPFLNDACAKRFQGIADLKRLSLRNTSLTNAAVLDLRALADLEELDLTGTQITASGIENLRTALPNCEVVWDTETQGK